MKIMLGYDSSKAAKQALELAKAHANAFGAQIIVDRSMPETKKIKIKSYFSRPVPNTESLVLNRFSFTQLR